MLHRLQALPFCGAAAVLLATLLFPSPARGQCVPAWLPGGDLPGTNGDVHASIPWDPDGAGPKPQVVVLAGEFTQVKGFQVANIVTFDPITGELNALGTGTNGLVRCLAILNSGELVAGGDFTSAGGVSVNRIGVWDGSAWSTLGTGMDDSVRALTVQASGQLVAGGDFITAGGSVVDRIASWNGSSWQGLGSGTDNSVRALLGLPDGSLVAGGSFNSIGGLAVNGIARWDGSVWIPMGSGVTDSIQAQIFSLARLPSGNIAAGGTFFAMDGIAAQNIAIWNGSNWSPLGLGVNGAVFCLSVRPSGELVAGGKFLQAGGGQVYGVASWNGSSWNNLGGGIQEITSEDIVSGTVRTLSALSNGALLAGGSFGKAEVLANDFALWNGSKWSAISAEWDDKVLVLATAPNGDLYAGGRFKVAGGVSANQIARFDGNRWSALGSGFGGLSAGFSGTVRAIHVLPNGNVVAGGTFATAGGVPAKCIAVWNGASWSALGSGLEQRAGSFGGALSTAINAITSLPNGEIVAGGTFELSGTTPIKGLARWDGAAWSQVPGSGNAIPWYSVRSLAVLPNGSLAVAGYLKVLGSSLPVLEDKHQISILNGSTWTTISFDTIVHAMAVMPNGDLVFGGKFGNIGLQSIPYIARWNGTAWSKLGNGLNKDVNALTVLPNGDLVAVGEFTGSGSLPVSGIARFNGTQWSALGTGLQGQVAVPVAFFGESESLAISPAGELVVSGFFESAGGLHSPYFARYATPCPATVVESNPGCASSGGNNQFTALTLPWLGSKFRTRGTGLPNSAVVGALTGYSTTAIPLAALLPPTGVGCTLWTLPDLIDVKFVTNGTLDHELQLKSNPAAIGLNFYQQLIVLELDQNLNVVETTSTNALTATVGFL